MIRLLCIISFFMSASVTFAATCADSEQIINRLKEDFGEKLILQSKEKNEHYFQVWRNDVTGTWSMFITTPDKLHCLVSSGKNEIKGLS